jgi:hypothetical protein
MARYLDRTEGEGRIVALDIHDPFPAVDRDRGLCPLLDSCFVAPPFRSGRRSCFGDLSVLLQFWFLRIIGFLLGAPGLPGAYGIFVSSSGKSFHGNSGQFP